MIAVRAQQTTQTTSTAANFFRRFASRITIRQKKQRVRAKDCQTKNLHRAGRQQRQRRCVCKKITRPTATKLLSTICNTVRCNTNYKWGREFCDPISALLLIVLWTFCSWSTTRVPPPRWLAPTSSHRHFVKTQHPSKHPLHSAFGTRPDTRNTPLEPVAPRTSSLQDQPLTQPPHSFPKQPFSSSLLPCLGHAPLVTPDGMVSHYPQNFNSTRHNT